MSPRKRLQRIIDECRQVIADVLLWNEKNAAEPPLGCEDARVMLARALEAAQQWDAGEIEDSLAEMKRLTDYAERSRD